MTEREIAIRDTVDAHPTAPLWMRLPIIRHIRAIRVNFLINRHYHMWSSLGRFPVNSDLDYAIRDAIWRGDK